MSWLQSLDERLFKFINQSLSHWTLDLAMPWFAGNGLIMAVAILSVLLVCKGGIRGVICVVLLLLALSLSDWVCNVLKYVIARPRPFISLADANVLIGRGSSFAMPSSHAANWFAISMVALVYYRKSAWFMLPLAILMGFSRVYNGVHYPSDVVVGMFVGGGAAAALLCSFALLWRWAGQTWFPVWWRKMPSLLNPSLARKPEPGEEALPSRAPNLDSHFLHLGYVVILVVLFARLLYIASDAIELTGDEAYQWLWSKNLDLSYYSKPPLIAYTQRLGTALWGDTAFGVRFFSPVIAAAINFLMLRFLAREVNARAGFFLVLISNTTPLLSAGAILMTVDPLSVFFWTLSMISGWRAIQPESRTKDWLWTGLWMGLGFLSKYTQLFQWLCWAVLFVLWPPARQQLRRAGPYLALTINLLCTLPVVIWNAQQNWITVTHVADNANLGGPSRSLARHALDVLDFIGAEAALLNPIFFVAMIWAAIAFWRSRRHDPRLIYFFSMGAPLFLCYFLWSFHSRILPNWIAPSVVPLFCLMVIFWHEQWRMGLVKVRKWLTAGLALGLVLVIFAHETRLIGKVTGASLPPNLDPLRRARGWKQLAGLVGKARSELLQEGKPVFIITGHYTLAGEISFYLPEANAAASTSPFVYHRTSPKPVNQFYFWPGYTSRKGENAIFVRGVTSAPLPKELQQEFESITDLGILDVTRRGRLIRQVQLYACRNLH